MGHQTYSLSSQGQSPTLSRFSNVAGGPENRTSGEGTASAASGHTGRITGEKVREERLKADGLVTILSPQLVQCKRCGAEIKLSRKSPFDTYHWYQHKDRCLKKPVEELLENQAKVSRPAQTWSVATKVHSKRREPRLTADAESESSAPKDPTAGVPPQPPFSSMLPRRRDLASIRLVTPTARAPSTTADSSTEDPESPPPASPLSSFSIPLTSATYELSSQAFERVQRWTLRDVDGLADSYPTLGEPYGDSACYAPRPYHVSFKDSQVRGTYE
ncbi:hypothetical protein BC629DRAFT_796438 [Irpex lacteus]|nr:hypothetical protein BC629DRAFT_796438 [Irpex lacteus]